MKNDKTAQTSGTSAGSPGAQADTSAGSAGVKTPSAIDTPPIPAIPSGTDTITERLPAALNAPASDSIENVFSGGKKPAGGKIDDTVFDPERHVSKTSRNMNGTFRRKKGAGIADNPQEPDPAGTESGNVAVTAQVMKASFVAAGMVVMGQAFAPSAEEEKQLSATFEDYCRRSAMRDLPPGVALAAGLIGYAICKGMTPQGIATMRERYEMVTGKPAPFFRKKAVEILPTEKPA